MCGSNLKAFSNMTERLSKFFCNLEIGKKCVLPNEMNFLWLRPQRSFSGPSAKMKNLAPNKRSEHKIFVTMFFR